MSDKEAGERFVRHRFDIDSSRPLAVYVHVPFCSYLCNFCGFFRSNKFAKETIERHVEYTMRELDLIVSRLSIRGRKVSAVLFGGGSASLLKGEHVEKILNKIENLLSVPRDAELTFEGECISLLKEGFLDKLKKLNFNRLSYGVQTTNTDLRGLLNIRPTVEQLVELSDIARTHFQDVSIDMIYGWPSQPLEIAVEDLDKATSLFKPKSIDLFRFEKLDADPQFMKTLYESGGSDLSTQQLIAMYIRLSCLLGEQGYQKHSMNFYSQFRSIDRINYAACYYGWGEGEVIGIGRGAQSFFGGCMWGNAMSESNYQRSIEENVIPVADFNRYLAKEKEWVTWPKKGWIDKTLIDHSSWMGSKVVDLIKGGYVYESEAQYRLTELGESWAASIMDYLMPEIHNQTFKTFNLERLDRI